MSIEPEQPSYDTFKKLSQKRIREALILLSGRQYSGAYYLAGYSIELALKACYCKNIPEKSFPPKKDIHTKLYSHDLNGLLDVSGIKSKFEAIIHGNGDIGSNWSVVKDWNEQSRYSVILKDEAKSLVEAISGKNGILNILKKLW